METLKTTFLDGPVDDRVYTTINPTPESRYEGDLKSDEVKLDDQVGAMVGREWFFPEWEAEATDGIEAAKVRYNAAADYLFLLARNAQDESRSTAERQQWADAFTQQSIQLYGRPDVDVAKIIEMGAGEKLVEHYQPVLGAVKDWLLDKYGDVFDALELDDKTEKLSSAEVRESFAKGLDQLKVRDPRWQEWQAQIKPGTTALSTEADKKTIFVGEDRKPADPQKLKGLFAHEVLRHALTALNGEDLGVETALPRYINAEEGFAKIYELAINGEMPTASMEKYADIAWVLGDLDGQNHTRRELVERIVNRKRERGQKITEKTETLAYNTANTMFRGTPGSDEVSGVFTKGVAYFGGFIPGLEFIKQGLDAGKSIDEVMNFANAAKFDPNDPMQKRYIQSKIMDRYLPPLPLALPPAPQQG